MNDISGPRRAGLKDDVRRARRLEWLSLAYICSCVGLLAAVMGGSQALKTEVIEDALSLFAPILFLIGDRISNRSPTITYPYGYERATSAAYFGAAVALLATGLFLSFDGGLTLLEAEHPSIGSLVLFGHVVWIGWLAIPTLLWCAVPAWLLGRPKVSLAHRLNDNGLFADAQTNTANWQSAGAAMIGILGVAAGFWWADAVAALMISLEIIRSGWTEVTNSLADLMDRRPQKLGEQVLDPLPERVSRLLHDREWICDAVVRLRKKGRELVVEAFVIPHGDAVKLEDIDSTARDVRQLDNRIHAVALVATEKFAEDLDAVKLDR